MSPLRLFFLLSLSLCVLSADYGEFVITSATRGVDLDSQFARHSLNITLKNTGEVPAESFYFAIPEERVSNLAFFAVVFDFEKGQPKKIHSGPTEVSDKRALFKIDFPDALGAGKSTELGFFFIYTHTMKALPAAIKQGERQLVKYEDHAYIFSPYQVKSQTTQFKLPSPSIENFAEKAPTNHKEGIVTYGPYNDVAAFSRSRIHLHFENNKPFITVTNIVRDLEISHWGNIAVEETLSFQHDGARHIGAWSRWNYHRLSYQGVPQPAIAGLTEIFPAEAADFYYRDEIGNISTSQYAAGPDHVAFQFKPRFPLAGGWKTAHYHGYNLPLWKYLFSDYNNPSTHVFNFTVAPQIVDAVIDNLVVRVILPEGAQDIQLHAPYPVENESRGLHFTYLDTEGRPVLTFEKRNLVGENVEYFQVTYTFSSSSMWHEPFLLISGYFTLLFLFIIYVRIDLGVNYKNENTDRVSEILLRFQEEVYDIYTSAFTSLDQSFAAKSDKDYKQQRVTQEKRLEKAKQSARSVLDELAAVEPSLVNRLGDLLRLHHCHQHRQRSRNFSLG
eukprot:TRINITY_DN208_c0_g1_i1.p1 TRINITY_DN208_c0_g1~~TRINITY_DN208_c0_g1_i1.p1  ORF type:complete len:559 (-),score=210.35 TRINITY_DN208_c0_g1_i1:279-1955(-)